MNLQDTRFFDFLYYEDPDYGVYGCPVYYKMEFGPQFSKVYDAIDYGLLAKDKLSYFHRTIFLTIKNFFEVKERYKRKQKQNTI